MTQRFAFYGRLSTDDKQDQTLARPSQLEACRRKAAELGREVTVEFFDQESGARDDRPGWTALTQEARDRQSRRFDAVVIYQTSRLSRDRVSAGLFHRELRKLGVEIHYALGAGDPATAEGGLLIALQQAFDEYERAKLARETKRGMRQAALQGFRCGGRPPYGYRLERSPTRSPRAPRPARPRPGWRPTPRRPRSSPRSSSSGPTEPSAARRSPTGSTGPAARPRPTTSTGAATGAATGPSRRSAPCSETPPTPAGWSGTGSTSPANAKPAGQRG